MVILIFICLVLISALYKKIDIAQAFSEGVKNGCKTVYNILPSITLMIISVSALRCTGLLDLLIHIVRPIADIIGIPEQIVPLAVLRPISGSGAFAVLEDIISINGIDSKEDIVGSVLCAASETTLYSLSLYLAGFRGKCGKIIVCSVLSYIVVVLTVGLISKNFLKIY